MWGGLLALIVVVLVIILLVKVVKKIFIFILNSVIGIFALIGFNVLFHAGVTINFWSVIITAIGGIIGFAIVIGVPALSFNNALLSNPAPLDPVPANPISAIEPVFPSDVVKSLVFLTK